MARRMKRSWFTYKLLWLESIAHILQFAWLAHVNYPFNRMHHVIIGKVPLKNRKCRESTNHALEWVHMKLWADFVGNTSGPNKLLRSTQEHHTPYFEKNRT